MSQASKTLSLTRLKTVAEHHFTAFFAILLIKLWYVPQFKSEVENTRLVFPQKRANSARNDLYDFNCSVFSERIVISMKIAMIDTPALVRNAAGTPNSLHNSPNSSDAGKTVMPKARL